MGSLSGLGWPCKQELWQWGSRALARFTGVMLCGMHRGMAPYISSCPQLGCPGRFLHHQFEHYNIDPHHTQQTRVRAHLLARWDTNTLPLCSRSTWGPHQPSGEDSAAPCSSVALSHEVAGMDRTLPAPMLPPPTKLSCAGLKTARFSPPLKRPCFEHAFWKFPV